MKRSFFSILLFSAIFFGCGDNTSEPTTTPTALPNIDAIKKDLIAYDNLLEIKNNQVLELRERFIELRAKSNAAGLAQDTAFQLKMNAFKTLGSKLNMKANMALDMLSKRRVELVMLETEPTDEFKVLCLRAIDMAKDAATFFEESKTNLSEMEAELNELVDATSGN